MCRTTRIVEELNPVLPLASGEGTLNIFESAVGLVTPTAGFPPKRNRGRNALAWYANQPSRSSYMVTIPKATATTMRDLRLVAQSIMQPPP